MSDQSERDCICAEIAQEVGFRLTDDQIKAVCDIHAAAILRSAPSRPTVADERGEGSNNG